MKGGRSYPLLLVFFLAQGVWAAGCAAPLLRAVDVAPNKAPWHPQRTWVGERAKVAVFEFENKLVLAADGRRSVIDSVFGDSLKKHLMAGLQQTEQFAVLDPPGAQQVLTSQDFASNGEIKRKLFNKLGPLGGAEFLIAGAVTAYQPSRKSRNAGVEADPFFGGADTRQETAGATLAKAFASLPTASQDRISVEMRLIDAASGKTISTTSIEGSPRKVGQPRGGLFDETLSTPSGSLSTPMQKALQAFTIRAVDWVADTSLAYRGRTASRHPIGEKPTPSKKPAGEKKNVREKPVREPVARRQAGGGRPSAEKPSAPKPVAEGPAVEQAVPKKEVPRSEEWGQ
jgi:curli biogenesis system outer membrane secretion channel CsgG